MTLHKEYSENARMIMKMTTMITTKLTRQLRITGTDIAHRRGYRQRRRCGNI